MYSAVTIQQEIFITKYIFCISSAFLYYDYFLTLPDEIIHIWRTCSPRSASSRIAFLLNRYLTFFENVAVAIVLFAPLEEQTCIRLSLCHQILLIACQVIVSMLLLLRVYALYNCNPYVLTALIVGGVAIASAALTVFLYGGKNLNGAVIVTSSGCFDALTETAAKHIAAPWEALFLWDTTIFALTLAKTRALKPRVVFWSPRQYMDLVDLLIRDGTIYFAVMSLTNLANVLTFYLAKPLMKGILSVFANCISVTMMSRLMLNLHTSAEADLGRAAGSTCVTSAPDFGFELAYAAACGSAGESAVY